MYNITDVLYPYDLIQGFSKEESYLLILYKMKLTVISPVFTRKGKSFFIGKDLFRTSDLLPPKSVYLSVMMEKLLHPEN